MSDTPKWYDTLDADVKAHITNRGLDKMDAATAAAASAKAHFDAQKIIGHPPDQVVKLPKDATDPTFSGIYDRIVGMATPKTAEEYVIDGPEAAFVKELALKHKLPLDAARGLAQGLVARTAATAAEHANTAEVTKSANQVALRTAWGGEYDQKAFSATRVVEAIGFTPEVLSAMAALPATEYVKNMNALASLSSQLNEAAILRGGNPVRNPDAGLDSGGAQAQLDALKQDRAWSQKYLAGDVEANNRFVQLTSIIARARADQQYAGPR